MSDDEPPHTSPAALPAPGRLLDLTGARVLVTGASGGLGHGIAARFAAAGADLVLHHRDTASAARVQDLAARLHALHGGRVAVVRADLTSGDGARTLVDDAVAAAGHLDVLVANAGVQPVAALAEVTDAEVAEVLEVNVAAVHRGLQAFAAHRRERDGGGAAVVVASIEGHQPAPGHGHYAASKAAVRMLVRAAALEYGAQDLRVNAVSPGLIDRPGLREDWPEGVTRWEGAAPLGRLGTPADVGDACVFLASPLARWVTGADLVVDGGVLARPTW